jgi:hypothetical protein
MAASMMPPRIIWMALCSATKDVAQAAETE